jgi:membrane protease YdiL (CAAX protease family)
MIGILVELLASWLLLWIYNKKSLMALGVAPSGKRLLNLLAGIAFSGLCCAVYFLALNTLSGSLLTVNHNFSSNKFLQGTWWTLKSVLFEELIFRGALLYIAIDKLGTYTACIVSAIAFGVYHWFSYGILWQPVPMIFVFLLTGVAGLMFAYAFAKTKSLYLPIGLHLGWNLVTIVVFSQGPLGNQLLIMSGGGKIGGLLSVVFLLYQVLVLPLIVVWYLRRQGNRS